MWNSASRQFFLDQAKPYPYATGGDYVYLYEDTTTGKTYRVHEFLSTGTSTLNVEVGGQMEYLIVGGGGGGGAQTVTANHSCGGGGAGGVLSGTTSIAKNTYSITVGSGGAGAIGGANSGSGGAGSDGSNSSFNGNTAIGGGGGGGRLSIGGWQAGRNGGSGGGGNSAGKGLGTSGQGNDGGLWANPGGGATLSGGGGGASQAGENASAATPLTVGDGGDGVEWPIGSSKYYGGGGGAGGWESQYVPGGGGSGGSGGGGNGGAVSGTISGNAQSGTANTGGGGGGGGREKSNGGTGGSGIVIVRYVVAEKKLWTPSELTSLKAWWDAADETTIFDATSGGSLPSSGNDIARWEDKSGGGYHVTQATAANRPHYSINMLNNKSIVEFSSQWLTAQTASDWNFLHNSGGSTVILVCRAGNSANPNTNGAFLGNVILSQLSHGYEFGFDDRASNNRNDRLLHNITRGASPNTINNVSADNVFTANNFGIVAVVSDPGNATGSARSKMIVNSGSPIQNNNQIAAASTANATYPIDIGADGNGTAPLTGAIAEIVMCNAVVSSTDRQKLEGYLAHKWGLTNNLPAGHPYKYEPPYKVEPEEIVTDGLVLNLDAGDYASYPRSGTTWYDISGNGLTGALTNGPTYDSANKGSIVFDGSDDYVTVNQATGAFSNSTMTVEFWIKPNSPVTSAGHILIMDRSTYDGNTGIEIFLLGNGNGTVAVRGSSSTRLDSTSQVTLNTWNFVSVVYNGSTSSIYINGNFINSGSVQSVSTTNYDLYIGKYPTLTGYNYGGNFGALSIYNRALSSTEISQNFNALRGRYGI